MKESLLDIIMTSGKSRLLRVGHCNGLLPQHQFGLPCGISSVRNILTLNGLNVVVQCVVQVSTTILMFKTLFKHYKSKAWQCNEEIEESDLKPREIDVGPVNEDVLKELGLFHPSQWKIYEHVKHPGLLVVKNLFTDLGQLQWIRRCVVHYPSPPNCNNLAPIGLISNCDNWFSICKTSPERKARIFRKLRWVTLGYHHNWDTKAYSDSERSPFPQELALLCRVVARVVGDWNFSAEAAIINYYYHNSTINGHTDHSEPNLDAPLLSFSFGDSAVFLIGGASLDDPASPIVIRSGDAVIMSGANRLSYHGVPRIIPADERPWTRVPMEESDEDSLTNEFISCARVNMNVRQVLFPGDKSLVYH